MLIFVDGIDKTGKDTLVKYINEMSNFKYCVFSRGPVSSLSYSKKFNRAFNEKSFHLLSKCCIIILLTSDIDDLNIRFKLTNELEIDKVSDIKLFNDTAEYLEKKYSFNIFRFNTSKKTPFEISKEVIICVDNIIKKEENNASK